MLGSALLTGVGAALALASLISVVIFLSNLFLISTGAVVVGAFRPPIAFPLIGAGVAVPYGFAASVGFFKPILVVGLFIPVATVGLTAPLTALLVSFATPRADFNAVVFSGISLGVEVFGRIEGRLDAILDAVDEDSVGGGRPDFNGNAVDGLFAANELLGFSMFSTNYCNFEISLFIVSI